MLLDACEELLLALVEAGVHAVAFLTVLEVYVVFVSESFHYLYHSLRF